MNQSMKKLMELRIARTVEALRKNNYDAHYIQGADALMAKIDEYLPVGASCTVGGSVTLRETGILGKLENGAYRYYDRYAPDAYPEEVFRMAFACDVYFSGCNAITEDGLLYNMDRNGNRVSAIIYGPKKVVVVAGYNKIVEDVEEARRRNRRIAAPANNIRLGTGTPCTKTGVCVNCRMDSSCCSTEVVHRHQWVKDRIAVLILDEAYGF